MFLEKSMKRDVTIAPNAISPTGEHRRTIVKQLIQSLENEQLNEEHCYYYVTPTLLRSVSPGKILPTSGAVRFIVDFDCLIFKLFRNEMVEVEVTRVQSIGLEASCGPFDVLLTPEFFGRDFSFRLNKAMGCYVRSEPPLDKVEVGSKVMVKILKVQVEQGAGLALGAALRLIKED